MKQNKEVVVITGSCGRIGTNIAKRLKEKYHVIGFELLKAIQPIEGVELLPVDLTSDESVHQAFDHIRSSYGNKIASIIHLAAYYSFEHKFSPLYNKITIEGTKRLLQSIQTFEVDQFLFSSTMLVHAPCQPGRKVTESSPLKTSWGYPLSKVQTEEMIHKMRGKMATVTLRIAGVYDDGCHSIPISNQIQRIYEKQFDSHVFAGDYHHGAAFLHMDDLVDAIELAVNKRKALQPELTLLIGEPKTMTYDQIQRHVSKLLFGKEIKTFSLPKTVATIGASIQSHLPLMKPSFIKPWMIALADDHYELDISEAEKTLGWKPKHFVGDTLPKMVEDLQHNPSDWYRKNLLTYTAKKG